MEFHSEGLSAGSSNREYRRDDNSSTNDAMKRMIHNIFRDVEVGSTSLEGQEVRRGHDENAKKFHELLEDARRDLYPSCKEYYKLSFIVELYLKKCKFGWSKYSFDSLLKQLSSAYPCSELPSSLYQARKMVKNLGLSYKRIDACPNDCMLYWKEHKKDNFCHVCKTSGWKLTHEQEVEGSIPDHGFPAKVLRYFPLKPRLQRLFLCSKTAELMTWHENGHDRQKDENLRHASDGQGWKDFDNLHSHFAKEIRNVRLGLTSDSFDRLI